MPRDRAAQSAVAGRSGVEPRRTKYSATPTVVDGLRFDSKREANRWCELVAMERAGLITDLRRQVRYPLRIGTAYGTFVICTYVADFTYTHPERGHVVEDSKGFRTREYRLKAKLFAAIYGGDISEV